MITTTNPSVVIDSGLHDVLQSKIKSFQQHVNRISALDDPCLRKLYYMRADWDKATETNDSLQGIFETGHLLEPLIERTVSEIGMLSTPRFRIIGTQMPTKDDLFEKHQISGTIDGSLQVYNIRSDSPWTTLGVSDIKTCSPNIYPPLLAIEPLSR